MKFQLSVLGFDWRKNNWEDFGVIYEAASLDEAKKIAINHMYRTSYAYQKVEKQFYIRNLDNNEQNTYDNPCGHD